MPVPKGYKLDSPSQPQPSPAGQQAAPPKLPAGYTLDSSPAPAAPQAAAQPTYRPADTGVTIGAARPLTLMERLRNTVANSAVGHSLEQVLPHVADALNLHPTETATSPTYQADKGQVVAPQYLMPSAKTGLEHVARGALTGVGQLTSGRNLATGAAIAATGGAAAPFVPAAAATAANVGMAGLGVKNVYDDAKNAATLYGQGQTDDALEAVGAALPNAALTLPAMGKPLEWTGERLKAAGVQTMDSYLKAGKKAYRYGAEPGKAVLQEGPSTSVAFTRQGMADNVAAAKARAGEAIPEVVNASGASVPRADLRTGLDSVLAGKKAVLTGPGGDLSSIAPLNDLRSTFSGLVDAPGSASIPEVYAAKRNLDENINWGRDVDPTDATVNNARREMRSNLSATLYGAAPELRGPSERYAGLSSADKLATDRTFDRNPVFDPYKIGAGATTSLATGEFTHDPVKALGAGLFTTLLPSALRTPLVRTGGATALWQGGRGIAATGRVLAGMLPATLFGQAGPAGGSPGAPPMALSGVQPLQPRATNSLAAVAKLPAAQRRGRR